MLIYDNKMTHQLEDKKFISNFDEVAFYQITKRTTLSLKIKSS